MSRSSSPELNAASALLAAAASASSASSASERRTISENEQRPAGAMASFHPSAIGSVDLSQLRAASAAKLNAGNPSVTAMSAAPFNGIDFSNMASGESQPKPMVGEPRPEDLMNPEFLRREIAKQREIIQLHYIMQLQQMQFQHQHQQQQQQQRAPHANPNAPGFAPAMAMHAGAQNAAFDMDGPLAKRSRMTGEEQALALRMAARETAKPSAMPHGGIYTPPSALPSAAQASIAAAVSSAVGPASCNAAGRTGRVTGRARRNENFTPFQYFVLERIFAAKPYPEYRRLNEYEVIAKAISLEPNQVRIWFQNRRSRQRAKMLRGELPRQARFVDDDALAAQAMPVVRQLEAVLCRGEKPRLPGDLEQHIAAGEKRPREQDLLPSACSSRRSSIGGAPHSPRALGTDSVDATAPSSPVISEYTDSAQANDGPQISTTGLTSTYILEAMAMHNMHPTSVETTTIASAVDMDSAQVGSWFARRAKVGSSSVKLEHLSPTDAARVATTVNNLRQVVRPGPVMASASRARVG